MLLSIIGDRQDKIQVEYGIYIPLKMTMMLAMKKKYNLIQDTQFPNQLQVEDDLERRLLIHNKKLRKLLGAAEDRIHKTGGLSHEEVWGAEDV